MSPQEIRSQIVWIQYKLTEMAKQPYRTVKSTVDALQARQQELWEQLTVAERIEQATR